MKNLAEYITEAGFDSNAQISKNREIINKYFTDFTISAAFPIKKQKNYKNWTTIKDCCPIHRMLDIHITKIFLYNRYRRIQSKYQTKSKMVMILSK